MITRTTYDIEELVQMLGLRSSYSIYRAAKAYRDTNGKQGIPNIQLCGSGSRIIFPKEMIDHWLIHGNKPSSPPLKLVANGRKTT